MSEKQPVVPIEDTLECREYYFKVLQHKLSEPEKYPENKMHNSIWLGLFYILSYNAQIGYSRAMEFYVNRCHVSQMISGLISKEYKEKEYEKEKIRFDLIRDYVLMCMIRLDLEHQQTREMSTKGIGNIDFDSIGTGEPEKDRLHFKWLFDNGYITDQQMRGMMNSSVKMDKPHNQK